MKDKWGNVYDSVDEIKKKKRYQKGQHDDSAKEEKGLSMKEMLIKRGAYKNTAEVEIDHIEDLDEWLGKPKDKGSKKKKNQKNVALNNKKKAEDEYNKEQNALKEKER